MGDSNIMVIDDEPMIVEITQNMLERLGYKITTFTDCKSVLKEFRKRSEK